MIKRHVVYDTDMDTLEYTIVLKTWSKGWADDFARDMNLYEFVLKRDHIYTVDKPYPKGMED